MSENLPATITWTNEQLDLIKKTIAKDATDNELKLFLYRAKELGLDPLKPGQIHFVKYGSAPGSIVVGIEGFRSKAGRTGKHVGTKRGVIRDPKTGKVVAGWAEVFRSDWTEPAREEAPLSEYNTGKASWAKMPETMIKKVAECAALRMAFPDELGGIYAPEEMEQAAETTKGQKVIEAKKKVDMSTDWGKAGFETKEKWLGMIGIVYSKGREAGWTDEEIKGFMQTAYGVDSSKKLNWQQLNELKKHFESNPKHFESADDEIAAKVDQEMQNEVRSDA